MKPWKLNFTPADGHFRMGFTYSPAITRHLYTFRHATAQNIIFGKIHNGIDTEANYFGSFFPSEEFTRPGISSSDSFFNVEGYLPLKKKIKPS
ncbi:MAG: hypothetical protein OEX02_02860 [Cyclobacteriaceae bacterium]|nr:hypothetical protein [Cyclobacteriaceae bacterium]